MSAAVNDEPYLVTGEGWYAEVYLSRMTVYTCAAVDSLPDALDSILGAGRRIYWTVEASDVPSDDGWDVWHCYLEL